VGARAVVAAVDLGAPIPVWIELDHHGISITVGPAFYALDLRMDVLQSARHVGVLVEPPFPIGHLVHDGADLVLCPLQGGGESVLL
jgi:hypothetical protein